MNGQYITTTELREESSRLVLSLLSGKDVILIHRSKVIGVIKPLKFQNRSIESLFEFKKTLSFLKPKKIPDRKNREKFYREHLKEKHGPSVS